MNNLKIIIGITAFNEEKKIGDLLRSILMQKSEGFKIIQILVINDGSSDNTQKEALKIKSKKIKVVSDGKRLGQTARINQIINHAGKNFDVIVFLDADIVLKTRYTIKYLTLPFEDKKTGMTSGRLIPTNIDTFLEKSIHSTLKVYDKYIDLVNEGNNIYAVKGAIMAISRKLANSTKIPINVFANDAFLYLNCLKLKLKFKRLRNATAWYTIPSTINDQIQQNSRFVSSSDNLEKHFPQLSKKEFSIDTKVRYRLMLEQLIRDPLHVAAIFLINLFSKIKARYSRGFSGSRWEVVFSTKL